MKILLIGSGGREHALAWKLRQSPSVERLWAAPGNPGIGACAELVALDTNDNAAVVAFARQNSVDLVVVGPEQPLVNGVVDSLNAAGIAAFGPTAAAAQLEGSKSFTKELCVDEGIPTARYMRFTDAASAKAYVDSQGAPIVIKADGLAAGKGVVVATTLSEAYGAIDACLGGSFGAAGASIIAEEFMTGREASLFALSDGETVIPFGTAQDYKRAQDHDYGPNTGGMGAISPAPALTEALTEEAMATIVRPTVRAMARRGTPFRGVLYAGLMLTREGPRLIEYNARFGDPECQVLMHRFEGDLAEVLMKAATGKLAGEEPVWSDDTAVTVVMAAIGYPGAYRKDTPIEGVEAAEATGATVFHAGTRRDGERLISVGGRVLNVTATGPDADLARTRAYRGVEAIRWPDGFCRRDIGAGAAAAGRR